MPVAIHIRWHRIGDREGSVPFSQKRPCTSEASERALAPNSANCTGVNPRSGGEGRSPWTRASSVRSRAKQVNAPRTNSHKLYWGEPPIRGRGAKPLNQSVEREIWWALQGSNLRHSACKADALPTELSARFNDRNRIFRREDLKITHPGLQSQLRGLMNNAQYFRGLEKANSVYHR